jgi:anti-sigma regulatory factor (Ser/Thr protein kinase)
VRLRVELDFAAISAAQDHVAAWLEESGLDASAAYRVRLVLEELLANLVLHGRFEGRKPLAEIALAIEAGGVTVLLADSAAPFDPRGAPEPAPPTLEGDAVGGLGLALVRRMAEIRGYDQAEDGGNVTRIWIAAGRRADG